MMKEKIFFALFYMLSISVSAATFPSMESGRYREYCEERETKKGVINQQLMNFCIDHQKEGYYKALKVIKKFENQKWIQDVIDDSIKQWTKKGMRIDQMVGPDLESTTDAFEELVLESKKTGFSQAKYEKCYAKWNIKFTMVWHCYKKD
jgi:hypothetical protein